MVIQGLSDSYSNERWEKAKEISRTKLPELLSIAVEQVKEQNKVITFYAVYLQDQFEDAKNQGAIQIPFVIAQIPGGKSDLERCLSLGLQNIPFEAKFFELREEGAIRGKISPQSVEFVKVYTRQDGIGNYQEKVKYLGNCLGNGVYEGKWEISGSCTGKFKMVRDSQLLSL
jgi:hypothetical protein